MTETRSDSGSVTFERGSPVQIITDRVFGYVDDSERLLKVLRRFGYRFLERQPVVRSSRWVRPLPLWLCHWVGIRALRAYNEVLGWLWWHGLIALARDEGVMTTWRDIRPPIERRGWRRRN